MSDPVTDVLTELDEWIGWSADGPTVQMVQRARDEIAALRQALKGPCVTCPTRNARAEALEDATRACEEICAKFAKNETEQDEAYGAAECVAAIDALKDRKP